MMVTKGMPSIKDVLIDNNTNEKQLPNEITSSMIAENFIH